MNARDRRQYACLAAMGIERWVPRAPVMVKLDAPAAASPTTVEAASPASSPAPPAQLDWDTLQRTVASCTACSLHTSRTQTVFGVGTRQARLLVVGEAPGAEEDRQGEPFVGRAGQLLNEMLGAIGLQRGEIYIANILKCRPPNNRDPRPEEVACCEPYLARQVELLQPRVILAVGRVAAQNLLRSKTPLGRLREKLHQYPATGTPLWVTYHPAYLLRSPGDKRKAWHDLLQVKHILAVEDAIP